MQDCCYRAGDCTSPWSWGQKLPLEPRLSTGVSSPSRQEKPWFPESRAKQARGPGSHLLPLTHRGWTGLSEALWDPCSGKGSQGRANLASLEGGLGGSRRAPHPQFKGLKGEKVCRFRSLLTYILTVSIYTYRNVTRNPLTFPNSHTHVLPFDAGVGTNSHTSHEDVLGETSSFTIIWISSSKH